jgi:hypothetical protein
MKQYVAAAGICIAAGIGLNANVQHSHANVNRISLTLAGAEALTNDETPTVFCQGLGSVDCPATSIKVKYVEE